MEGFLERVLRLAVWGNRSGNGRVELGGYPGVGGEAGGGQEGVRVTVGTGEEGSDREAPAEAAGEGVWSPTSCSCGLVSSGVRCLLFEPFGGGWEEGSGGQWERAGVGM